MALVQPSAPKMVTLTLGGLALLLSACSSSDSKAQQGSAELLDSNGKHYGHTYAELAEGWINYIYSYTPPDCIDPVNDATGEHCALNQDPSSDVFFLVGSYAGKARRTECAVPGDKPLFFPILNTWGDNAGLPSNEVLSAEELTASTDSTLANFVKSSIHLEVDGAKIDAVDAGLLDTTPYVVHLPEGPNSYTCQGQEGVVGDFDGFTAGYYAFLAPLGAGKHTLSFGGTSRDDGQGEAIVDVSYTFTAP